nr:type I-E CRISPR-associated endoribonuclease Cas2e [Tessaracoccus aquimaris]
MRGHLTRWLLEVSPGVFVGHLTTRIRDHLWLRVLEMCKDGRAIMIFGTNGEQRLGFKVHNHSWEVVDVDGVSLMRRQEGGMKTLCVEDGAPPRVRVGRAARVQEGSYRRFLGRLP